jgi:predicted ribosome quality control (RQC) complex YloA/Tae2 family protein
MALDGIVLRALRTELEQTLLGGRIEKIYQPLQRDVLLLIRNHGRTHRLLISANPTYPRVMLAQRYELQNPPTPPMFCMLLRKHLEGGWIREIKQIANERILQIGIEAKDELGEPAVRLLIVEIMGRHSNVILLDPKSNTILDSIVHVSHATSRHRQVLPGRTYLAPPSQTGKHDPFTVTEEQYRAFRAADPDTPLQTFLVNHFLGISPLLARELAFQAGKENPSPQAEWLTLHSYLTRWGNGEFLPHVCVEESNDQPKAFSILPLHHLAGKQVAFASISACMEWFYEEKVRHDTIQQKAGDLLRILKTERDRNEAKIEKLQQDLREAQEAETYRIYGELVTASLHTIKRGDTKLTTVNYYDPEMRMIEIQLDPLLSPAENAQAYFRKYNKKKQSVPHIEEQMERARQEIRYLEEVMVQIEQASYQDLDEIREELEQQGYILEKDKSTSHTGRTRKGKSANKPSIRLERYLSPEGVEILVGKNNKQNDYLTTKLANKTDTWLHTKDIPGSHVVIRAKSFSEETLVLAAQLAAYYSKGRDSNQVPVDYTLVKHTWKPNGAKPGMILYENQRTLFVKPSREGLQPLP